MGAAEIVLVSLLYATELKVPEVFVVPRPVWGPLAYSGATSVDCACAEHDLSIPTVLLQTTIGYLLITWTNKHTTATIVAAGSTLQPVTTAVLAYFILNTVVTLREALGGTQAQPITAHRLTDSTAALVLAGLALVTWQQRKDEAQPSGDPTTDAVEEEDSIELESFISEDASSGRHSMD